MGKLEKAVFTGNVRVCPVISSGVDDRSLEGHGHGVYPATRLIVIYNLLITSSCLNNTRIDMYFQTHEWLVCT